MSRNELCSIGENIRIIQTTFIAVKVSKIAGFVYSLVF